MEDKRPYEELKFYQDICEIRRLVHRITERFRKTHLRMVGQMRDASRSAKQNIREGYRRGSLPQFLNSIRISQGSLEELSGDMEDCLEDNLITQNEFQRFSDLCRSANYLSTQYLRSMNKEENREAWKFPGKPNSK